MTRKSPALLAAQHLTASELGKLHYKQADAALEELLKKKKVGDVITLPNGKPVVAHLRGKKFRIRSKGWKFPVGQNARSIELEEITA